MKKKSGEHQIKYKNMTIQEANSLEKLANIHIPISELSALHKQAHQLVLLWSYVTEVLGKHQAWLQGLLLCDI